MSTNWIDISTPLHNGMVCWPGDAPFQRTHTLQMATGAECNLSQISSTAHIGTHMDAPVHFLEGGAAMESMPISAVIGRARVIEIRDPASIRLEEIEPHNFKKHERILFKTANSARCWKTSDFLNDFIYISPNAARYLAQCGIQTIGVDYLSVGAPGAEGAETHRILMQAGIWIIEGLQLEHVEPGEYELFCLPLKIIGSDGAPARAVLRKLVL